MSHNLISSQDLVDWASRMDARHLFPRLVRRLIAASVEKDATIDMRADEGVAYAGWDGTVTCSNPILKVPEGSSAWELGCNDSVTTKANDDYDKRTADPLGIDPATSSFVFATPRRWPGKQQWIEEKQAQGRWQRIIALDADDLAAWLEELYYVHVWATRLLKKPIAGESLDHWWHSWREMTSPEITADMVLAGRGQVVTALDRWLDGDDPELVITCTSADEALAVVAAAMEGMPELRSEQAFARTLVFKGSMPDEALDVSPPCLILTNQPDGDLARRALAAGHRVIVAANAGAVASKVVEVPKLDPRVLSEVLAAAGVSPRQADRLAAQARRSFPSFRREIARVHRALTPTWARGPEARILALLVLLQQWRTDCEADRMAVEALCALPYTTLESQLAVLAADDDPPIRRDHEAWSIVSPQDVWQQVQHHMTNEDLKRVRDIFLSILKEEDPKFDLPANERWYAPVLGKQRDRSDAIRSGVADSLRLVASHGTTVPPSCSHAPATATRSVCRDLLEWCAGDEKRWLSTADILEHLAEAAPGEFLSACEQDLDSDDPMLPKLYVTDGGIMASSPHVRLLWALERLAWNGAYLTRAARILAQLAAVEPDGNYGNRAGTSLHDVFLSWRPHTTATVAERLGAIDALRRGCREQSWKLLFSLLPATHGITSGTSRPKYAPWAPQDDVTPKQSEIREYLLGVVERILEDADSDISKLEALAERIDDLPEATGQEILARLQRIDLEHTDSSERKAFSDALRAFIARHRSYSEEDWTLDDTTLGTLEAILTKFEPDDPVDRHAWLFRSWVELPSGRRGTHDEQEQATLDARVHALEDIREEDVSGLCRLARAVDRPWILGQALAHAHWWDQTKDEAVLQLVDDDDAALQDLAAGLASIRARAIGIDWLNAVLKPMQESVSPHGIATLALQYHSSPEVWNAIDGLATEASNSYWNRIPTYWVTSSLAIEGADRLMKVNRRFAAINLVGDAIGTKRCAPDAGWAIDLALSLVKGDGETDRPDDHFSWSLGKLLDYVIEHCAERIEDIAAIEWALLPALNKDLSDQSPRALHLWLQQSPSFFVELVSLAYPGDALRSEDITEEVRLRSRRAGELLDGWRGAPGMQEGESLDAERFQSWTSEALQLLAQEGHVDAGVLVLGQILSGSREADDGRWPCDRVCELIEEMRSDRLERGIENGRYNGRGMTSRGVFDGGNQERALANQYSDWASSVDGRFGRTAEMLRRLAKTYEAEALRHDDDADKLLDRYGGS